MLVLKDEIELDPGKELAYVVHIYVLNLIGHLLIHIVLDNAYELVQFLELHPILDNVRDEH